MVQPKAAFSTFAVPDLDAARRFYGETLGLDVRHQQEMDVLEVRVGDDPPVTIYPKPDHKPAGFTVYNLLVDDINAAVDDLNKAGVRMDRYDMNGGGMQPDDRNVYRGMGPAIAWFKDPAGNILSVMEQPRS